MNAHHILKKVGLDKELSVLLDEALEHTGYLPGSTNGRKWLAQLAVEVVCQAIVAQGGRIEFPLAVTLRAETQDETNARMMCRQLEEGFQP